METLINVGGSAILATLGVPHIRITRPDSDIRFYVRPDDFKSQLGKEPKIREGLLGRLPVETTSQLLARINQHYAGVTLSDKFEVVYDESNHSVSLVLVATGYKMTVAPLYYIMNVVYLLERHIQQDNMHISEAIAILKSMCEYRLPLDYIDHADVN